MIGVISKSLTKEHVEIIKTSLYFDVFRYPLTREELYERSPLNISREKFNEALNQLLDQNFLNQKDNFILINNLSAHDISKRLHGNAGAKNIMPTAYKYSKIVASFPFVEGICLSGALSKNYYDENGDIDFFIITKPGRLWICRSLLILRYKFLPKHKKKFWCVNYFISSDNLTLPDINAFTATELAFLNPTVNYSLYENLLQQNQWYRQIFPNKALADSTKCFNSPKTILKSTIEKLLGGRIGSWIDTQLLNITLRHWQKKFPELATSDFELQFRSQKNVCKRHTKGFQNKVLYQWQEKQKAFETKYQVSLH